MADLWDEVEQETGKATAPTDPWDEVEAETTPSKFAGPAFLQNLGRELPDPTKEATTTEVVKSVLPRVAGGIVMTAAGALQSLGEADRAPGFIGPPEKRKPLNQFFVETGEKLSAAAAQSLSENTPENMGFWQDAISEGVVSLATAAPWIATGQPQLATIALSSQSAARSYAEARAQGMNENEARGYAARQGMIEAATEYLPTKFLTAKGKTYAKKLILDVLSDVPGEITADTLGQINNVLSANPDATAEEIKAALPDATRMAKTAVASVVGGTGMAGVGRLTDGSMPSAGEVVTQTLDATKQAAKATGDKVKAAATAVREPIETSRRIIRDRMQKGAENTLVEATTKEGDVAIQAAKNLEETEEVSGRIGGGFKVGLGQATGDPGLLTMQRRLQMQDEEAKVRRVEQELTNLKAEEDYMRRTLPEGELGDALAALQKKRDALEKQANDASAAVERAAAELAGMDKVDAGDLLRTRAQEVQADLKGQANKLYGAVDQNIELAPEAIDAWDQGLQANRDAIGEAFQDPANNPIAMIERARAGMAPKEKAQFKPGDEVRVTIDGQELKAKVTGELDPTSRKYKVQTDKGSFDVRWDNVRDIPAVKQAEGKTWTPIDRNFLNEKVIKRDNTGKPITDNSATEQLGWIGNDDLSLTYIGEETSGPNSPTYYVFQAPDGRKAHFQSQDLDQLYRKGEGRPDVHSPNVHIRPSFESVRPGDRIKAPDFGSGTVVGRKDKKVVVQWDSGETREHVDLRRGDFAEFEKTDPSAAAPEAAPAQAGPERPKITFGNLMDFRSQVVTKAREAKAAGKNDLARKLYKVLDSVETTIAKVAEDPNGGAAVEALREANKFYRDVYVPTVRRGATSRVLKTDRTGGQKVDPALVGREYFKPGAKGIQAAKDFKTTFGDNAQANKAIEDHATADLLDAATDPQTGLIVPAKVRTWIARHKEALAELGLTKKFGNLESAMRAAEGAKRMQAEFEKTRFAKAIESSDPEKALQTIFGGSNARDTQATMRHLLNVMQGDQQAINGLKRAFGDFMRSSTRLSAENMAGDRAASVAKTQRFYDQFGEAMKILYTKEEMQMMDDLRKAASIQNRINQPTSGVAGSQTADLIQDLTSGALDRMLLSSPKMFALRIVAKRFKDEWAGGVREYINRAMYDPRMAGKLKEVMATARAKGPEAAEKQLRDEVAQTITDTGPVAENRRVFLDLRDQVNSIQDERMRNEIITKMRDVQKQMEATEAQRKEWERLAKTDPLTQVGNRLAWDKDTEAQAQPIHFSTDLNGFKFINDKFKHHVGDQVLQAVTKSFEQAGVKVFRFGGDEFVGGVPNKIDLDKVAEILSKKEFIINYPNGKQIKFFGVDIGIGTGNNLAEAETTLKAAKDANRAKRRGGRPEGLQIEFLEPGKPPRAL
jgi:diguanylate cyclase (GGDEF)-like protein